jgi:hypothetical protein
VAPGNVSDDGASLASPEQPRINSAIAPAIRTPLRIQGSVPIALSHLKAG